MSQSIAVVGLDFRTAAIEIREQLALAGCALEEALQHLATGREGKAADTMRGRETVILSTCNRLEFYLLAADEVSARAAVSDYLEEGRGISAERFVAHLYCFIGDRAV